jgi:hypothetical protein
MWPSCWAFLRGMSGRCIAAAEFLDRSDWAGRCAGPPTSCADGWRPDVRRAKSGNQYAGDPAVGRGLEAREIRQSFCRGSTPRRSNNDNAQRLSARRCQERLVNVNHTAKRDIQQRHGPAHLRSVPAQGAESIKLCGILTDRSAPGTTFQPTNPVRFATRPTGAG